jgi:hypothetical protein
MIIIVPAPNDKDAPNAMVDNNVVAIATVASAMSRKAASPPSTWTAVQRTSSAGADPSSLS